MLQMPRNTIRSQDQPLTMLMKAMLDFAEECNRMIKHTQLSIVDVLPEEDIKTCQQIA